MGPFEDKRGRGGSKRKNKFPGEGELNNEAHVALYFPGDELDQGVVVKDFLAYMALLIRHLLLLLLFFLFTPLIVPREADIEDGRGWQQQQPSWSE